MNNRTDKAQRAAEKIASHFASGRVPRQVDRRAMLRSMGVSRPRRRRAAPSGVMSGRDLGQELLRRATERRR